MNRKDLGKISVIVSTYNRCDALLVQADSPAR